MPCLISLVNLLMFVSKLKKENLHDNILHIYTLTHMHICLCNVVEKSNRHFYVYCIWLIYIRPGVEVLKIKQLYNKTVNAYEVIKLDVYSQKNVFPQC